MRQMWLALLVQASALIVHVRSGRTFCATFPESDAFEMYNITTQNDVLLARFTLPGGEDVPIVTKVLDSNNKEVYRGAAFEEEVLVDVDGGEEYRFCVESDEDQQLIFALHRSPKMSELADKKLPAVEPGKRPHPEHKVAEKGAFDAVSEHLSKTDVTRAMLVDMYRLSRDLKEKQEQLQGMDDTLDEISTTTTFHVTIWSVIQSCGLILISFFQIYYLKSFFEVKQFI